MLPRLDEIEADLLERKARAEAEKWLGELEGIDLTLTYLRQKREQALRLVKVTEGNPGLLRLAPPPRRAPSS